MSSVELNHGRVPAKQPRPLIQRSVTFDRQSINNGSDFRTSRITMKLLEKRLATTRAISPGNDKRAAAAMAISRVY